MKYEFTDEQVKNLRVLIANANIKGNDALTIVGLLQALQKPAVEKEKEKVVKEDEQKV